MSFEFWFFVTFLFVFFLLPGAVVIADRCSDGAHRYLAGVARRARRELAAWLLAKDGLTVVPARDNTGEVLEHMMERFGG